MYPAQQRPLLKNKRDVTLAALVIAGNLLAFPASAENRTELVANGQKLSQTHCSRCHVIGTDRFAGIASSPSFKIMIEVLDDWEDRFATFMARNPHPAHMRLEGADERPDDLPSTIKEVILTQDQIDAILAYVDQMAGDLGRK